MRLELSQKYRQYIQIYAASSQNAIIWKQDTELKLEAHMASTVNVK
jgi:hypothetical protein